MDPGSLIVVPRDPELGQTLILTGPALAALRSWSPRPGQAVTLTGPGASFRARVVTLAEGEARLLVFERMTAPAESSLELILLQALPDKERMELVIEKATELGVTLIVPWQADRGLALAEREARQPKAHRFARRALQAGRQCRRGRVPVILPCTDLNTALEHAGPAELKIVLYEKDAAPLKAILAAAGAVTTAAIMIGPEGGLTAAELDLARAHGFRPASLGSRVLRTETAALAGLALLQFALGDLGGPLIKP